LTLPQLDAFLDAAEERLRHTYADETGKGR
jgi:hypothetical protein